MHIRGRKYGEIFEFISKTNQTAYNDIFLLSNSLLSKNPVASKFIENCISGIGARDKAFKVRVIFFKVCKYYLKSLIIYLLYLLQYVLFRFSGQKYDIRSNGEELVLVNVVFYINKIIQTGRYSDLHFPGLEEVLKKRGKEYAYLPNFYGTRNPLRIYRTLKLLKKQNIPVLTEYQLLSLGNLISLFYFLLAYPIHVINFVRNMKVDPSDNVKILAKTLMEELEQVVLFVYLRYLQGKRIASLPFSRIKCISWYENQSSQKNLYRGLREGKSKVSIIGAQLFLWPARGLYFFPDKKEEKFGVVPDKILVNGKYYMPQDSQLNCSIGPSLRYKYLFDLNLDDFQRKKVLVLLPYYDNGIMEILDILRDVGSLTSKNVLIKFHPGTDKEKFLNLLPSGIEITEKDLCELFKFTKTVIGRDSGTLVEAVSAGIPVVVIEKEGMKSFDYLPRLGKGIIWSVARNKEELIKLLHHFDYAIEYKKEEIRIIAKQYREMFFCEPTEDKIIEAFDL